MDDHEFGLLVVDEATQVKEELLLCGLARGAERLVMIGDPQQLSFCLNDLQDISWLVAKEASDLESKLLDSPFKRMISRKVYKFLDTQYRMVEPIARFPSKEFYEGRLKTGNQSSMTIRFPWTDTPVAFMNVDGREAKSPSGSYHNQAEIKMVKKVLECVLTPTDQGRLEKHDVCVLSPYKEQANQLKDCVPSGVECGTVDSFQGRESSLVIVSTVRANGRTVGFSDQRERVNVLLTRAKFGMVVIGHEETLKTSDLWSKWLEGSPKVTEDALEQMIQPKPKKAGGQATGPDPKRRNRQNKAGNNK